MTDNSTPKERLDGKVALITGAGSGIGAGIATALAEAGAHVMINDIREEAAHETADLLRRGGLQAGTAVGDITDDDAVVGLIDVCEDVGGIDILVNNAGITGRPTLDEITREVWDSVLAVNLTAPFLLARAAAPRMRAKGTGRIINVASIAGIRISVLGGAAYTASKSGLIGLTRHLASELAVDGITVNTVLPGVTLTPLVAAATDEVTRTKISASVPAGRMGTPADIGSLVVHLAGDAASYLSGADIPVDGGLTVLPGDYTEYRAQRVSA